MTKVVWAGVALALGVAGCSSPPPPVPPVWSTNYAVPFDTMVNCMISTPSGAFSVGAPTTGFGGVITIIYVPTNVPQANSYFRLYHVPENGTQVSWFRANDVMGIDWIDGEARTRANACGGVPYQGDRSYQGSGQ
jgi:hypothetical protein